jgi:GNAT superfamily N-acetyltransferase
MTTVSAPVTFGPQAACAHAGMSRCAVLAACRDTACGEHAPPIQAASAAGGNHARMEISTVDRAGLEGVLGLIAAYQRFYGVAEPDHARNRAFFARFCDGDAGILLQATEAGAPVGVATVYWTQDSISAADVAVLYDLFVAPEARGRGVGHALIDAAAAAARERGLPTLSWMTAVDNHEAQRLYDRLAADRSTWHEYVLAL